MNTTNKPTMPGQALADAIQAGVLLAELDDALSSNRRYLDRELAGAAVKLDLNPQIKEVLRSTAFMIREDMANFSRIAINERIRRVLDAKIAAGEAK